MGTLDGAELVEWCRFVREPSEFEDEDDGAFVELVQVGSVVYERSGRIGGKEREIARPLSTDAAAAKSVARKRATLAKEGYLLDDPVLRPLFERIDARTERERLQTLARAKLSAVMPAFVTAYEAAGFDPTMDFVAACVGKKVHPNRVASDCLGLVSSLFGVEFSRRTHAYDEEHGTRASVPERLLAEFYGRPADVVALAREKLRGRNTADDDLDAPGLSDEVQAELVALARRPRGSSMP